MIHAHCGAYDVIVKSITSLLVLYWYCSVLGVQQYDGIIRCSLDFYWLKIRFTRPFLLNCGSWILFTHSFLLFVFSISSILGAPWPLISSSFLQVLLLEGRERLFCRFVCVFRRLTSTLSLFFLSIFSFGSNQTDTITMPSIVLKKTSTERGLVFFSLHGTFVSKQLIEHVNDALSTIPHGADYSPAMFAWNEGHGHYSCQSNNYHDNEEDVLSEILEVMECMNWKFHQHNQTSDSSSSQYSPTNINSSASGCDSSEQTANAPTTSNTRIKECWIFRKDPVLYELYKPHANTDLGVVFSEISICDNDNENGNNRKLIYIKRVIDGGLFYRKDVPAGIVVLGVNGIPFKGKLPHQIATILYESVGQLSLMTTTITI